MEEEQKIEVDEMGEDSLRTTLRSDNRGRSSHNVNTKLSIAVDASANIEEEDTCTTMMEPLEGILKDPDSSGVDNQAAEKPKNWHSRKISWGENDIFQAGGGGGGGLTSSLPPLPTATLRSQSVGSARSNESSNVTTSDAASYPSLGSPSTSIFRANREKFSGGKIELNDVLRQSPMETEATTYILRAIEQRESSSAVNPRGRSNSIMSNITDETLHHTLSNLPQRSHDDQEEENSSLGSQSAQQEQRTPSSTSSRRLSLTSSRSPVSAHRHHRRTATMEERLFGLTSALENAQQMWEEVYVDGGANQETSLEEEPLTATKSNIDEPMSSADALQQNASILYHRAKSKRKLMAAGSRQGEDENGSHLSDQSSIPSASSRWQKLRNAVVAEKALMTDRVKNKDERLVEYSNENSSHDEEVGNIDLSSKDPVSNREQEQDGSDNNYLTGDKKRKEYEWKLFREFQDFFDPHKGSVRFFVKFLIFYIVIPVVGLAAIIFYLAGNPPVGVLTNGGFSVNGTLWNEDGEEVAPDRYSASWMLLFLLRQTLTGSLAKLTEFIVIDFLSIRSKGTVQLFGPWPTLFILQSRGGPFILTTWSIFNFCLLYGSSPFFSHWLFFQDKIELFNRSNPSGSIVTSEWNRRILSTGVSVGLVVAIKRFWLGLYLGKQIFSQYSEKLVTVMNKIVLINQVANLGRDFENEMLRRKAGRSANSKSLSASISAAGLDGLLSSAQEEGSAGNTTATFRSAVETTGRVIDPDDRHPLTGSLSSSQKLKIVQLLGAWEEPTVAENRSERISVSALLQFRRAMACLNTPFPFSGSFGLADTRESCIQSAQEVYERLTLQSPNRDSLNFEVLALLGVRKDDSLDQEKLKELIRLFRPDRDGSLSILEFVKSIDLVYRDLRLLHASVTNSSKIDQAFENIFNVIFYAIVITVIISRLGFDPLALFLSISGVVLAFAFMIGSASSKYFEGLLFILARRPYQIGDAIHVSNVETDTSYHGSAWWIVQDVTLFTTTVIFLYTGERATLSNGSLASSRIINSTMSPQAYLYITLKFPVDVSYEKLQVFHSAVEQFLKNRPREWLSYLDFRALRVEANEGFIEYMVAVQHRQSWADWGTIMLSKAHLIHFSLELSKKLNIWYKTPPLPVNLSVSGQSPNLSMPSDGDGNVPSPGSVANADVTAATDLTSLYEMFAPKDNR